jgi:hypothetical protein
MNTTALIAEWSMCGARRDVGGRFRTTDDIRALLSGGVAAEPPPASASLLVKPADEDDWRPLVAAEAAGPDRA